MKNNTIFKLFGMLVVTLLVAIAVFVWPVPEMISAKDTSLVLAGGAFVVAILLGITLFINSLVKKFTDKVAGDQAGRDIHK